MEDKLKEIKYITLNQIFDIFQMKNNKLNDRESNVTYSSGCNKRIRIITHKDNLPVITINRLSFKLLQL